MNDATDQPVLLTLVVPPDVEESVVDWVLARGEDEGFSTMSGHGHGVSQAVLSVAEQVAGRQARTFVEIQLPLGRARELLVELGRDFHRAGFHYWIAPLIEAGPLREPDETS